MLQNTGFSEGFWNMSHLESSTSPPSLTLTHLAVLVCLPLKIDFLLYHGSYQENHSGFIQ